MKSPSSVSNTAVPASTSAQDSVQSPLPASPAEQRSAMEPDNDNDDKDDNNDDGDDDDDDDELSAVPQVMVGPDGNIVINPGR